MRVTRRGLLAGIGGMGVAVAGGVSLFATAAEAGIVEGIVRDRFAPLAIDSAELGRFAADFLAARTANGARPPWAEPGVLPALSRACSVFGMDGVRSLAVGPLAWRVESLERSVVSDFALTTNAVEVCERGRGQVRYHGFQEACGNPFARFDLD